MGEVEIRNQEKRRYQRMKRRNFDEKIKIKNDFDEMEDEGNIMEIVDRLGKEPIIRIFANEKTNDEDDDFEWMGYLNFEDFR